ncbi:hypothetical protein P7K49_026141 [Saguinus oedipus]|uniref:Uncharacterized protein n=1 Tax=Saguinus oedipus TaxID=9490 RepID=A0ABQ9UJ60_SAGOE|nr:hypothetical protein P7K49_026141 [Saguinus oedipus]
MWLMVVATVSSQGLAAAPGLGFSCIRGPGWVDPAELTGTQQPLEANLPGAQRVLSSIGI